MNGRVLIHAQHLLGVGHLMRAARIARASAAAGLDTVLASGGPPMMVLDIGGARLVQLPPMRAGDAAFTAIVDDEGRPIDDDWRARRRAQLLELFGSFDPDVLVTELFPFGRRQCRFELLPLLAAAVRRPRPPVIVSSVRDIVHTARKPGRAEEAVALITQHYDWVLVHGDAGLVAFGETFPLAATLAAKTRYTGYVAPPRPDRGEPGQGEVIVAAGGGAVGLPLLRTALAARPFSALSSRRWRLLAGGGINDADLAELYAGADAGVIVEPARADYAVLLANCAVSVSQAGYNTAMDVLAARARAVFVPFVGVGETEQSLRAQRLAERAGGIRIVREEALTPAALARAIDGAATGKRPDPDRLGLDMDGAAATARFFAKAIDRDHRHAAHHGQGNSA